MENTLDILRVSDLNPSFGEVDGLPVCTRTWYVDVDPQLKEGDIVDIGGTICRVTGKVGRARTVTYQFSPADL